MENESSTRSPQLVSTFDHSAGGAISIHGVEKAKAPLVILGQKNRDWREESRKKGRNLLPNEVQSAKVGKDFFTEKTLGANGALQDFGLNFVKAAVEDNDGDVTMVEARTLEVIAQGCAPKAKTVDEEALEALMGNGSKTSTLVLPVIPANDADNNTQNGSFTRLGASEDDSFRSDVASRPDSASLDDYAAVPIEEFGAALLRGMGWKEGDVVGKRKNQISVARIVERRPALLGIGAKEVPGGVGEEFGAWGKAARGAGGKRKVEKSYNPVLLRNFKTGEMLTEEELHEKKEARKREEVDWRERRDRNLAIDEGKKNARKDRTLAIEDGRKHDRRHHHRDKDRDRDRDRIDSSRNSSSRRQRDRSRSVDGNNDRHTSSKRHRSPSLTGPPPLSHAKRRRSRSSSPEREQERKDRRRRDRDDDDHGYGSGGYRHERREYDGRRRDREMTDEGRGGRRDRRDRERDREGERERDGKRDYETRRSRRREEVF